MEHRTLSGGDTLAGGAPGGGGPDFDFGATLRGFAAGQVVFSRYRLERMLGRGGMGVVWLARDRTLEVEVALKFLPDLVAMDAEAVGDLKRETRRTRELAHHHIVKVFEFLQDGPVAGIAMEYVDGPTLSALKAEEASGCFDVGAVGAWLGPMAAALDYAHGTARVVHRDLKPGNLMLNGRGELKVTDFGIARSLSDSVSRVSVRPSASGTLAYMSPQQLDNEPPRAADDIYALGATLYDLITGKPPFYGGDMPHLIRNKMPPPMAQRRKELGVEGRAEIPPQWEAVVAACLDKDPARRPGSAGEVVGRLEAGGWRREGSESKVLGPGNWGADHGTRKTGKRAGAVVAVGLILAAIGAGGWWFGIEKPKREAAAREAQVVRFLAEGEAAVKMQDFAKGRMAFAEIEKLAARDARAAAGLAKLDAAEREAVRLAAARGGVEITTDPPGAEVTVGGVAKGPSPLRQGDLRLGKYPLTIAMRGYDPVEREIEVVENQFANPGMVRLVRSLGTLQIATEPGGQRYEISLKEGEAAKSEMPEGVALSGTTPVTLEGMPTGTYAVKLAREGWPDYIGEARVERGKVGAVSWEFAQGALSVTSEPPGAEVLAGGKSLGTTPLRVELPTGTHELVFRYKDWPEQRRSATVEKGREAAASVEYAFGSVVVTSDPAGAEVYSGTTKLGVTPLKIGELKPGAVTYGLRLKGYKAAEVSGVVEAKKEARVGAKLVEYKGPVAGEPWENSLGMKFVSAGTPGVLFSVHETRVKDYMAFAQATGQKCPKPSEFEQTPDHPVVCVDWNEAKAFCAWLTRKERDAGLLEEGQEYRLPTDHEWSVAVGVGDREDPQAAPEEKHLKNRGVYPWGTQWPPPEDAGNYRRKGDGPKGREYSELNGNDGFEYTAPVGRFRANRFGLFDMGGNVLEWCEDLYHPFTSDRAFTTRVMRGSSFIKHVEFGLQSSSREACSLINDQGFRAVVVTPSR